LQAKQLTATITDLCESKSNPSGRPNSVMQTGMDLYVFVKRKRSPKRTTGYRAKIKCGSETKTTINNKNMLALLAENASEEANKTTDSVSQKPKLPPIYILDYYERAG